MMKRIIFFIFFIVIIQKSSSAQDVDLSIGYEGFYDNLSPYGVWVDYPGVGYVWKYNHSTSPGFRPYYSRGHWIYTDYGWIWVSDYPWGWATFHYGRWFYDDYMGWLWLPGNEWAPAWVTWGNYEDNFAWAPISPGIELSVAFSTYRPPYRYWTVCPGNYFGRTDWNSHVVNISHNTTVVNNITIINNREGGRGYARGPEASRVQQLSGAPVRALHVASASRPITSTVSNNRLAIYRPTIQANNAARPRQVRDIHSMRPAVNPSDNPALQNSANRNPQPVTRPAPGNRRPQTNGEAHTQRNPNPPQKPVQPQVSPARPPSRSASPAPEQKHTSPANRPGERRIPRQQTNQPSVQPAARPAPPPRTPVNPRIDQPRRVNNIPVRPHQPPGNAVPRRQPPPPPPKKDHG